jgi:hypothetical protein
MAQLNAAEYIYNTSVLEDVTFPGLISVSGSISFYGPTGTPPMTNVKVELKQSGLALYTIPDADATYSFPKVCPGTYEIVMTKTETGSSINATDAAQANYWFSHNSPMELVRYYAGDVAEAFNFLGPVDAQRIQGYFVSGGIIGFDRTNKWTFWKVGQTISSNPGPGGYPTVIVPVSGPGVTANFYGLVTGDFNRSYTGPVKDGNANLELVDLETRLIPANTEFDLPVRVMSPMSVGAVSLILDFPSDLVEVSNVSVENAGGQLDWAASGNELRIGWNSTDPMDLATLGQLLVLKLRTTMEFAQGQQIRFTAAADPLNELADAMFEVIPGAILGLDVIGASTTGIDDQPVAETLVLENHPNPFYGITTFDYSLPYDGRVTIEISGMLGSRVINLVNEYQARGRHSFEFHTQALQPGVYTATLKLEGKNDDLVRTVKIIRAR